MGKQTAPIQTPAGLIACRCLNKGGTTGYTKLSWEPVLGAFGYHVYARANESKDNDYQELAYERVNREPIRDNEYRDSIKNVTYRVTAVGKTGEESEKSVMVFPLEHRGIEILALRYQGGEEPLTHLPSPSVNIHITAINSTEIDEEVYVKAEWDQKNAVYPITLLGDGRLHEYEKRLGQVITGPINVWVENQEGERISCLSKFRPEGTPLFDTLFERGLLVCDPFTETLFDSNVMEMPEGVPILSGKEFSCFHMAFDLAKGWKKEGCKVEIGEVSVKITEDNQITVAENEAVLASAKMEKTVTEEENISLHLFAENDTLQIFEKERHMPLITAMTKKAAGQICFTRGDKNIVNIKIISQKASFAGILPFGCTNPNPIWDIACWHSRWNFIRPEHTDPVKLLPDKSMIVENEGRSLWRSRDGSRVILTAKGSREYQGARKRNEGWTHLLLEVLWDDPKKYSRCYVEELKSLWITMDMKLLQCENRTKGYNPEIHASQFVVYFNIKGKKNEAMWLGLCNMDNRYLMDEHRKETVCQMDPGTNTFIIALPQEELMTGHLSDCQWHSMSLDLKPLIRRAYENGRRIGAFKGSQMEDLWLNSMNLGFEIPGSFDSSIELSNLQLAAQRW